MVLKPFESQSLLSMWSTKKCEAEAVAENEVSEDISPAKMKCEQCEYNTEAHIPKKSTVAKKLQLYGFHIQIKHPRAVGGSTTEDSRRKVKFPQPGIDQGQPL